MTTVEKLYELIQKDNSINTYFDNQDLFFDFFLHNMDLIYGEPHVIDIFKYILSLNFKDEDYEYGYINSKIFDAFNKYELKITQSIHSKDENNIKYGDNYVDMLVKLIEDYYELSKRRNNATLNALCSEYQFIRDVTDSMMILLNNSFFELSNDNIKKMMIVIRNNKYLKKILDTGSLGKELLDTEYIYDYVSRFLCNSYLLDDESIENDELLIALKEGKIKDKKLYKYILKKIDPYFFILAFDDLPTAIDSIEEVFEDEVDRRVTASIIINKLIKERYFDVLIDFIMYDDRNERYIDPENRKSILVQYPFSTGEDLTSEEVNYYLDNNYDSLIFLHNLTEELLHNEWDEETIERVQKVTKDIEFYDLNMMESIRVLDTMFSQGSGVNYPMLISALKRLIKNYVGDDSIKVFITYKSQYNGGTSFQDENTIVLNAGHVIDLLNTKDIDSNPEALDILDTLFHEARHIVQYKDTISNNIDDELYKQYKEDVLTIISHGYYERNYYGVSYERDARIHGAKGLVELLTMNYPYMTKSIEYYTNIMQKEIDREEEREKHILELSSKLTVDDALEKIISINPSIVIRFPLLRKEYDLEGKRINGNEQKDIIVKEEEKQKESKRRKAS